ncbi:hypothetical protein [Hasllibacter halocynthiae]|uniref:hypothetical protein n=1 Tax=Hasllibacter halocynthiae TaxID=595589 RepID=UPI0011B26CC5|nr:hypothetical protein [Hasllibacter halocynthiae]
MKAAEAPKKEAPGFFNIDFIAIAGFFNLKVVAIACIILMALGFFSRKDIPWQPGGTHPSRSNVIASEQEGVCIPAPGYTWTGDESDEVAWSGGQLHPNGKLVSSFYENEWFPADEVVVDYTPSGTPILRGREKDAAPVIGASGVLPGRPFLASSAGDSQILLMYSDPDSATQDIDHFVYGTEYRWLAAVLNDGEILEVDRWVPVVFSRDFRESSSVLVIDHHDPNFLNNGFDPEIHTGSSYPLEKTSSATPAGR